MSRVVEPLKQFKDYSETTKPVEKQARVFFMDSEFKPLFVNKTKIAKAETLSCYKNHMQFLPRVGDSIMIGEKEVYKVKDVIHSLPSMNFDTQKIYIVLE